MLPYKTLIHLNRKASIPLYLQLCNSMIQLIKNGQLVRNNSVPSSRVMAQILGIHRKTVLRAYEELALQGWLLMLPAQGTFVHFELPITRKMPLGQIVRKKASNANFKFKSTKGIATGFLDVEEGIQLTDGLPDWRIAPWDIIGKHFRNLVGKEYLEPNYVYGSPYGNTSLREELLDYLQESRGMKLDIKQLMTTRGSQYGLFLAIELLVEAGDVIVVGETTYRSLDEIVLQKGGKLLRIPVDKDGLHINSLEKLCEKQEIKAIYVCPHHHHPTTVTLSMSRRMALLELAEKYNFAVLEDDYDFDFHYKNAPILPLASADNYGNVIYVGSFSKLLAPAIRVGFMVGPPDFIKAASEKRRLIDRQGSNLLELVIARMIANGELKRHTKKSLLLYKKRRDNFCNLLEKELKGFIRFRKPEGGMAIWVVLDKKYNWETIRQTLKEGGIGFGNPKRYDVLNTNHNGVRLGFASLNEQEQKQVVSFLKEALLKQQLMLSNRSSV